MSKEIKTWGDLLDTKLPFVSIYYSNEMHYYPIDDGVYVEWIGGDERSEIYEYKDERFKAWLSTNIDPNITIDYFEEEPNVSSVSTCTCDLYTVLLVTGCKCGGK